MITPLYLKKGDRIGFVATARKISSSEIQPAKKWFEEQGFSVDVPEGLFREYNQLAGTDSHRAEMFQRMLDDDHIRAMIVVRGGYGTIRMIDQVDFTRFRQKPKWICGFSDVTVLHSHIQQNLGIETLHSIMPFNFIHNKLTEESLESLRKALTGESISYQYRTEHPGRNGSGSGVLCGGNLSVLYSLTGSKSEVDFRGKILFLEDLDEYIYHIDRMIMNLKRSGKLAGLAGLVIGGMTEMKDNQIPFGKSCREIILEATEDENYPVCFDFPAGHTDDNRAIIMGRETEIRAGENIWFHQK